MGKQKEEVKTFGTEEPTLADQAAQTIDSIKTGLDNLVLSGEGEDEDTLPLGSDTVNDGPGDMEGGESLAHPPLVDTADYKPMLPTEEELKAAFENTPGLSLVVAKVLGEMFADGTGAISTRLFSLTGNDIAKSLASNYVLKDQIDRKFGFTAVSNKSCNIYDESNAVVFLARDPAFLYALDGYLTGCIALGADIYQIDAVKALKERVMEFQERNATKLPDVEAGEERDRGLARF